MSESFFDLFVGTYSLSLPWAPGGHGVGVHPLRVSCDTAETETRQAPAPLYCASYQIIDATRRVLYSTSETLTTDPEFGIVSAYRIQADGSLELLNTKSTHGHGCCYLSFGLGNQYLFSANYCTGQIIVFRLEADGRIGDETDFHSLPFVNRSQDANVNTDRQCDWSHAHCVLLDPANRFAFVADLAMDMVYVFAFDQVTGKLTKVHDITAHGVGVGPRQLVFHPNGRCAYLVNELDSSVSVFNYDSHSGNLRLVQTAPALPLEAQGMARTTNNCSEHAIHPSGRYLYVANRGHDSIQTFSVDPTSGCLSPLANTPTQGKVPRHFCLNHDGTMMAVANQNSDNIVFFNINESTGIPEFGGRVISVPTPTCVRMLAPPSPSNLSTL